VGVSDAVMARSKTWNAEKDYGCESELDEHVNGCCEEGKVEVQMFWREHPFVVLGSMSVK
jgi:hypothetical protein